MGVLAPVRTGTTGTIPLGGDVMPVRSLKPLEPIVLKYTFCLQSIFSHQLEDNYYFYLFIIIIMFLVLKKPIVFG